MPSYEYIAGLPTWALYDDRGDLLCTVKSRTKDGAIQKFRTLPEALRLGAPLDDDHVRLLQSEAQ